MLMVMVIKTKFIAGDVCTFENKGPFNRMLRPIHTGARCVVVRIKDSLFWEDQTRPEYVIRFERVPLEIGCRESELTKVKK